MKANGFYLLFLPAGPGNQSGAPAYWLTEIATGQTLQWKPLAASMMRLNPDGTVDLFPQTANQNWRNSTIVVDMRPTWPWIIQSIVLNAVNGLAWFSFLIAASSGREHYVKDMAILLFVSNAVLIAAAAIGYRLINDRVASMTSFCNLPQIFVVIFGLIFREDKLFSVLLLYGILGFCFQMVRIYVLYSGSKLTDGLLAVVGSNSFLALLLCCAAAFFRRRVLRNASNLVMDDKLQYDRVWLTMLANPDSVLLLCKLKSIADSLVTSNFKGPFCLFPKSWSRHTVSLKQPNQNLKQLGTFINGHSHSFTMNSKTTIISNICKWINFEANFTTLPILYKSGEPIDSLDQLFAQAHLLAPILQVKVAVWASRSGGLFQMGRPTASLQLEVLRETGVTGHCGQLAGYETKSESPVLKDDTSVKGVLRAMEKIVRSYGQVAYWIEMRLLSSRFGELRDEADGVQFLLVAELCLSRKKFCASGLGLKHSCGLNHKNLILHAF